MLTLKRPRRSLSRWTGICFIAIVPSIHAAAASFPSKCFGTPGHGRIIGAVQLPAKGANFAAYSELGVRLGRTYVHSTVRAVVLQAYAALAKTAAGTAFVYGETGGPTGGPFAPHRTHQSGVSVDFMVPVLNSQGRPVPLPATPLNNYGYGLEFDSSGRSHGLHIDFEAIAQHLVQLVRVSRSEGVEIKQVIFDPQLVALLLQTKSGPTLKSLPFMKERPWVRHDEHYHVDFSVPCRPFSEYRQARQDEGTVTER